MSATLEIIASATDRASNTLKNVGQTGSKQAGLLERSWLKISVAGAAAGVALEAFARKSAETNQFINRLAASTDMTQGEVRDLTASLIDATFPLADVNALLETGRQRGLKSAEALHKYAKFWDMVGDATGEGSNELARAGVALEALGVSAGQEGQALTAFGFIAQETTGSVGEFLTFIERTGPELRTLGVNVNDAAAVLGILEHELGMSGRMARQEFRKAVSEADGDLNVMLQTLGVSATMLDTYRAKVDSASGAIERNAEIHAESRTFIQRMGAAWERAQVRLGKYMETASALAPILMAMGPTIKGLAVAKGILTAATVKLNIALLASPLGIVIAGMAAVTAAGVLLYKNWDMVKAGAESLWEGLKTVFKAGANAVIATLNAPMAAFEMLLNAVASGINSIPAINIPDWVPGVGGKRFGVPQVPTASLPRIPSFSGGGTFHSSAGAGLAMLHSGESVTTKETGEDLLKESEEQGETLRGIEDGARDIMNRTQDMLREMRAMTQIWRGLEAV